MPSRSERESGAVKVLERAEAAAKILRTEVEAGVYCDADWLTVTEKVLEAYGVGPLMPEQPRGAAEVSEHTTQTACDDGLLHVWECAWVLRLPNGNPDFKRCGHIARGPGNCPYDHGEDVPMVEVKALVLCSDCEEPIMRDDSRASDDARLICGQCVFQQIGQDHA